MRHFWQKCGPRVLRNRPQNSPWLKKEPFTRGFASLPSPEERRPISDPKAESLKIVQMACLGNACITSAKMAVWFSTGSSAMLAEAIHSLVDSGNQGLLMIGLMDSNNKADKKHPYGYGKSIYFWSLVSALGTFWGGACVSMWTSTSTMIHPQLVVESVGFETWGVLGISFAIDGLVLRKTISTLVKSKPAHLSFLQHLRKVRDPTTLAVLMEDGAACLGVLVAALGIGATQMTGMVVWDGLAGIGVSGLLAAMGVYLARLNQKYLLGQAVDTEITEGIRRILAARPSIDEVHDEQSQWIGPYAFAYKAEVDFDGTFLAAKLLERYQGEFMGKQKLTGDEVKLLLSWYAEDVMRTVEQEVKDAEAEVKRRYPEALYIELEPDSSRKFFGYAIDEARADKEQSSSSSRGELEKLEIETLNQLQRDFRVLEEEAEFHNGNKDKKDKKP